MAEQQYHIEWKNIHDPSRHGVGTNLFNAEDVAKLCAELNHDFPEIEHKPVEAKEVPHAS